jgi:hypothetical protein
VLPAASEYWGSSQAALSIAAWSTTQRVRLLDRRVNVPLHELALPERWSEEWAGIRPLHVHYHWLLRASQRDLAYATMARLGVPPEQLEWIREHAALIEKWPVPAPARRPAKKLVRSRQLVISGMHRSGTSLVASVLREAGLEIGWDLMGPAPGNWRGHFEDSDFNGLHEEMLAAAGATSLTADDGFTPPMEGDFARRARTLIEDRSGFDLWGFKDPRTLLVLDFWDALLPESSYLFLYRHPIEVALSLRRRATDREIYADPWIGIRSWEVHNRRLLGFLARHPRKCFLAHVPALAADLPRFIGRVASKLDLPLGTPGPSSPFAPDELSRDLEDGEVFPAWEGLMPDTLAIYAQLEAQADLPSTWNGTGAWRAAGPDPARPGEKPAPPPVAALFEDLLQARLARESGAPAGALRWTVMEEGVAKRDTEALVVSRQRVAELEELVAAAAARRDELATTLAAIERSRGFGMVASAWRLAGQLKGITSRRRR